MIDRILITTLSIVTASGIALAQDCPNDPTRYTISTARPGTAHVRISLTMASELMSIANMKSEDGTMTEDFISNVSITGDHGTTPMESAGNGNWSAVPVAIGDRATIEYDLDLAHGEHRWPHGREEIGFALGDGAFLVSRTTLMADYGSQDCTIDIEFEADESAAPWKRLDANLWRAASLSAFHNNCFTYGKGLVDSLPRRSKGRSPLFMTRNLEISQIKQPRTLRLRSSIRLQFLASFRRATTTFSSLRTINPRVEHSTTASQCCILCRPSESMGYCGARGSFTRSTTSG